MMRALATTCFVLALVAGVASQQQAPPPTFRSSTQLIVQTVTVKDAQGRPVLGLTARDFIVTEDGRPQEVVFVEYEALDNSPVGRELVAATPAPPPAAVDSVTRATATVPASGDTRYRGRRLLVFYFDLVGMDFFDKGRAFAGAGNFIAQRMTAADMVAVMVFAGRGVELRSDFTDDRAALTGVIRELEMEASDVRVGTAGTFDAGGAFGEDAGTFNLFSTDRQLNALQTAVTDLGPLPQAKTLIYIGAGLGGAGIENMAQLRATVNAAVRSNVTLNPLDTRGLQATPPMGDASQPSRGGIGMFSGAMSQNLIRRADRERDVLFAIAKDTGGRATFDNNDLGLGMADTAAAVTGYYILGYYPTNTEADGRYRRVRITLAGGRNADLTYRQGYYGNRDYRRFTAVDKERQLAEALRLEDPITEIPMAMEINYFQISSAEYFVPMSVRMPGRELARLRPAGSARVELDVIGEIKNEHGVTMRNSRDRVAFTLDAADAGRVAQRPVQYETGFSLLPGNYVIKMLARDDTTGRIGTYLREFSIPNLEREQVRLPTSSVVLTQQRVASTDALFTVRQRIPIDVANPLVHEGQRLVPGVSRTFRRDRPLHVYVQAYPASPEATTGPLAAYVAFYREGVKVFETEPLPVPDGMDPKTGAVPIRLTVPLTALEPGAYACQLTILDPSGARAAFWRAAVVVEGS
jgi:VWFA-related protein